MATWLDSPLDGEVPLLVRAVPPARLALAGSLCDPGAAARAVCWWELVDIATEPLALPAALAAVSRQVGSARIEAIVVTDPPGRAAWLLLLVEGVVSALRRSDTVIVRAAAATPALQTAYVAAGFAEAGTEWLLEL